jgi:hypothetical protein
MGHGTVTAFADYPRLGWALIPTVIAATDLDRLDDQLAHLPAAAPRYGMRDVLDRCPEARMLAHTLTRLAVLALGCPATLIRGLLLAKPRCAHRRERNHAEGRCSPQP